MWKSLRLLGFAAVCVALVAVGVSVADEVRAREKVRIITTDENGQTHEETYEFDGDHHGAYLGIQMERVRDGDGAGIGRVVSGSAAERAGLEEGDVIVGFNGDEVRSPWQLRMMVRKSQPGDSVDLEVLRDGELYRFVATLDEPRHREHWNWHHDFDFNFDMGNFHEQMRELRDSIGNMRFDMTFPHVDFDNEAFSEQMQELREQIQEQLQDLDIGELDLDLGELDLDLGDLHLDLPHRDRVYSFRHSGRPKLGVQLVDTTPELRRHLGGDDATGVLVSKVLRDSPAEEAGVEVGDLITAVDDVEIRSSSDLVRALRHSEGQTISLEIIRDGRRMVLNPQIRENRPEPASRGSRA